MRTPETLGKREFATMLGQHPSHVTKMLNEGRLVMEGSGIKARVRVAESLERIAQTGGGRPDEAIRQAHNRAAKASAGKDTTSDNQAEKIGNNYQAARAVREKYAALKAKAEYETLIGNLIPREDVDAALRFVGATIRSLMDVFPDQQAPILCAVSDIHEVNALLTEACRNVLVDIGSAIERQTQAVIKK